MRIYFLMILLLCSVPLLSQSCDYTLSGVLTDLHDGSVLEGATLIVAGSERFVVTDSEGTIVLDRNLIGGTEPDTIGGVTQVGEPGNWAVTITITSFNGDGSYSLSAGD